VARDREVAPDSKLNENDVAQGMAEGTKYVSVFYLSTKISNCLDRSAGMLSEEEWAVVLRNCNIMYGWTVDIKNNRLCRAPQPGEIFSQISNISHSLANSLSTSSGAQHRPWPTGNYCQTGAESRTETQEVQEIQEQIEGTRT
jgi:hypothetical protein